MKYFAYGSNMLSSQMGDRCNSEHSVIGIAHLNNYRLIINERGVASIIEAPGDRVIGVVWEISKKCEDILDGREGVRSDIYFKKIVSIKMSGGVASEALVYIASNNNIGKPRTGYLERLILGAREHGIDEDYVNKIKSLR